MTSPVTRPSALAPSNHFFFSPIPTHQVTGTTQSSDLTRLCNTYTAMNNALPRRPNRGLRIQTAPLVRSPSTSSIESDAFSGIDSDDNMTVLTAPVSPLSCEDMFVKPLENRTLYYDSAEARAYLRQRSFEEALKHGFGSRSENMTLRITLTPWHGRATDNEIYGRPSHSETKSVVSPVSLASPSPSLSSSSSSSSSSSTSSSSTTNISNTTCSTDLMTFISLPPPPRPKKTRAQLHPDTLFLITPSQPQMVRRVQKQPLLLIRRR